MPVLDTRGVLLLDAATFVTSAALLTFLPSTQRDVDTPRGTFLADTKAGLKAVQLTLQGRRFRVRVTLCRINGP